MKMNLLLLTAISATCLAQESTPKLKQALPPAVATEASAELTAVQTEIKQHAEACAKAQLDMDFDKFVPYMPKKLIELMGGKAAVEKTIRTGYGQMKEKGITFQSVKIGTPSAPAPYGPVNACLVPQTIIMNMPEGKLKIVSNLVGVSDDSGKTWVFIDTAQLSDDKLAILYPDLAGKLKLPPRQKPELIKE
jgi:hypothetical protein